MLLEYKHCTGTLLYSTVLEYHYKSKTFSSSFTIVRYKIFFSAKVMNDESNTPELYLGSVSEDFTKALQATSKTESIFKFKTALDTKLIEKTRSESYLYRNIEMLNLIDTLVALILNCMFHKHLLDQNSDLLNKTVSVFNFLA